MPRDRLLKAARQKQLVTYKGNLDKPISRCFSKNFAGQKGVEQYIQNAKRKKPTIKSTLPVKAFIQI